MKILYIDVNCNKSSTGKIVYDLYNESRKEGHEAAICYGRGIKINEQNIFKFGIDIETYFHALMTRITGLTGCFSCFSTRKLLKFMKAYRPDVVHIHELHAYFVNLVPVINFLKKNKIKTIWTFHCEFMYTGKCGHSYECEKWKAECGKCPQVKEYPSSLLFDFTKKMFKKKKKMFNNFDNLIIVTPSKWLANRVEQSFLGDRDIKVIHNGIDTSIFCSSNFSHLKIKHNIIDEKIVLAVAPDLMSDRKGGKWVLKLAKRLRGQNIKFILIGVDDLNEKFDDNVIALARTENQQELAEYYSMADLFIICSKRENFPTTCIEALSCGTPVVGFDEGGTKETAPEGLGLFGPYGDIDVLEKNVLLVLQHRDVLKSKDECEKYGLYNYSRQAMYRKYRDLFVR